MGHDEPRPDLRRQVDRLGRRHVARHAPRRVAAVDRQEEHVERLGPELASAAPRKPGCRRYDRAWRPSALDDEPQIEMASRGVACRVRSWAEGMARIAEPGDFHAIARRPSPTSRRRAGPAHRRGRGAPRADTSTAPGEAAIRSGSVPGSRWSECLWLASTRSTPVRSPPRSGDRVIRTCGLAVPSYLRQVLGKVRVDDAAFPGAT